MLSVGIVGLPNVGKSTVFNALSCAGAKVSNYPFCTIEPNHAVVPVPDPRLERVARIFGQEKATPATIEFVDIAGLVRGASKGEGLGNQFLAAIREVDVILHVVRCFPGEDIAHVEGALDPARDVEIVNLELVLADLGTVERRQQKLAAGLRMHRKEAEEEAAELQRMSEHLNEGKPARTLAGGEAAGMGPSGMALPFPTGWQSQMPALQRQGELHLLTDKPVVYLANVGEDEPEAEEVLGRLRSAVDGAVVPMVARLESDLAEMEEGERAAFVADLGVDCQGMREVVAACYQALDLVTFFTGVGAEARAWAVPRGTKLAAAAGRIHTDMERGFIRAEVIGFDALDASGSWQEAHRAGKVATEGRDYEVREGDVVLVRFQA